MSTFNAGAIEANLSLGRSAWVRDLRKTQKEIENLEKSSITIGIDADTTNAQIAMDNLELMLDDMDGKEYQPTIDLLINEAQEALEHLEERLDRLDIRTVTIGADADIDNAMIQLDNLEAQMDLLEHDQVNIKADANVGSAEDKLAFLQTQVSILDEYEIDIKADADTAAAEANLVKLGLLASALDHDTIDIDVDVDQAMLASLVGSGGGGGGGGGGSMGLLKIALLALVALSPLVAAATSSATAAIVALAGAVVGALGPVVLLGGGIALLIKRYKDALEAGGKLPPEMQVLKDALDGLNDAVDTFVDLTAYAGFNLMAQAVDLLADVLPKLAPLFNMTASVVGVLLQGVQDFVNSPEFDRMLDWFGGSGLTMLYQFARAMGNLLVFFGRLFEAIQPFTDMMMQGFVDLTASWANWADDLANNKSFQEWLDNAMEYGPMVLDLLGSIVGAFVNLGRALEPFAGPMITILTQFFDMIANADPDTLTLLIGAFAGFWGLLHVVVPLVGLLTTGIEGLLIVVGFLLSPIGLVVLAIAGLVAMFVYLWQTNEDFRNFMIDTWNYIKDTVAPVIEDIVNIIKDNWGPLKDWLHDTFGDVADMFAAMFELIATNIASIVQIVSWIWMNFGDDLVNVVKGFVQIIGAWIRGFVQMLTGIFQFLNAALHGDWAGMWAGLRQIFKGFVTFITGSIRGALTQWRGIFGLIGSALNAVFGSMVTGLKNKWTAFRNWIGDKFQALKSWVQGFHIDGGKIWDGIVSGFRAAINKIIGWWNGLSFHFPGFDPPGPGPKIPGFTISTPNVGMLAKGAYVTEAMLAVVGEGKDPEVVAPEPVLRQIVRDESGGRGDIDYGRLAAAVAAALAVVIGDMPGGVTEEQLERLIEAAAINVSIDARDDAGGGATKLAKAIGFELRVLGFGGRAAA